MTTMVTEVYDALLSAGAPEGKARLAAEVLANYDDRFNRLERQIDRVRGDLERQIGEVKTDVRLLKWQVAALFAMTAPVLWLVLRIAAKVGALPG